MVDVVRQFENGQLKSIAKYQLKNSAIKKTKNAQAAYNKNPSHSNHSKVQSEKTETNMNKKYNQNQCAAMPV